MTDKKRRTVIDKTNSRAVRSTVIEKPASDAAAEQNPRQTVVEPATTPPVAAARATLVEASGKAHAHDVSGPAQVFRSLSRPPMALLTALDDGSTTCGEVWRLRKSRITIGRGDCDIAIPHDPDMSTEHAELVRREHGGGHQWHLIDLGSTNGTFVRVDRLVLRSGRELLLGGQRLTFLCSDTLQDAEKLPAGQAKSTQKQASPQPHEIRNLGARLIEQTTSREHPLASEVTFVGRDPNRCSITLAAPFVTPQHARISQDKRNRWVIRDCDSLNGVWVRVPARLLDDGTEFLLGGQRFRFSTTHLDAPTRASEREE